jgi:sorting nexin-29
LGERRNNSSLFLTLALDGVEWFQIPAELIQAGGETLHSEIHKLIILIWNKEELPHQWKESIIVLIHKKGDKTDCSNYRGKSLLSTSYNILSNILLSRLIPYADEITGDHQCGFRCNRSTTDQMFYIRQILEKMGSIMAQYISYL